ncbi:MAG: hypothetical protein RLZZ399_1111 [Verrucomicrobiota bacterium]
MKWEADLGEVNGRRVQRYFPTRDQAEEFLRESKASLKLHGSEAALLSLADRVLFSKWKEELAKVGATIEQAGAFFLKHHLALKKGPPLVELGRMYLDAMRSGGDSALNSDKTIDSLKRPNLRNFFRYASTRGIDDIQDINRDLIQDWLNAVGGKAETKKNRIRTVRHFLEWSRQSKFTPFNPIMGRDNAIAVGEEKKGDILSYGVSEVRALLTQVLTGQHRSKYSQHTDDFEWVPYTSFMGYVAAALFCGLRPEEINRTPLSNLDLMDRRLVVTGRASKTNKPRVIELSPVATAWFRLWRRLCPEQESLMPETFPGRWRALRAAAGVPSLHDGLRHTFASMHYAEHQNAAHLQAVMGHDETQDTLFAHYRAVKTTGGEWITKKMAREFWGLMPTVIRDKAQKS